MAEFIKLADHQRRSRSGNGDPYSRSSGIIDQVQELADQAASRPGLDPTSPHFVRRVIAARTARLEFFSSELFADPAWDMLLDLYALQCEQRRTSVSKLCMAAGVPPTTALRWIDKLQSEGLVVRTSDPMDGRRVWISLSTSAFDAMRSYLQSLSTDSQPI